MNAPARCADCFFFRCDRDCACRCHREAPAVRCLYCRTGNHHQCQAARDNRTTRYPDVLACTCSTYHNKEEAK